MAWFGISEWGRNIKKHLLFSLSLLRMNSIVNVKILRNEKNESPKLEYIFKTHKDIVRFRKAQQKELTKHALNL